MTRCARRLVGAVVVLAALGASAACSSSGAPAGPTTTRTFVQTETAPAPTPTYQPPAPTTVAPLPPGRATGKGEVDRACPYIKTGLNETSGGGVNVADIEGDRIYRTTVLTAYRPVGCRFYFYAPPYEAVADIQPRTFATANDARNALVLTARTGTEPISEPAFVPGVDGIAYRTTFFGTDGARDWAFAFAKGTVLVVVHTQRSDTSRNAVYLGRAIVGKF